MDQANQKCTILMLGGKKRELEWIWIWI